MDKSEFVLKLVKAIIPAEPSDDDILTCMIVLHTFSIKVTDDVSIDDAGAVRLLSPLTRNHCAETVAAALGKNTGPRSKPEYWYVQYDLRTPYEVVTDIQSFWKGKVEHSVELMKDTGLVSELVED